MRQWKQVLAWLRAEDGRDIIEYVLLMAFIMLASGALLVESSKSTKGVWTTANSVLGNGLSTDVTGLDSASENAIWNSACQCWGQFFSFDCNCMQSWQDTNPEGNNYAFGAAGEQNWSQYVQGLYQTYQTDLFLENIPHSGVTAATVAAAESAYDSAYNLGGQVWSGFSCFGCQPPS